MLRSYEEINQKIREGKAVVVTAEEVIEMVKEKGLKEVARQVDVVTTGTFGIMCSSGAFLNIGHTKPRMKISEAYLNGVMAYCGLAAVDMYIGATQPAKDDPLNKVHPGEFRYGGGHVIQDLVAGKDVLLEAYAYGTDCYPRKKLVTWINLKDLNEAYLFNPRNAYQNYNVAVNLSDKTIYTYMGILLPRLGNAGYSSAGQLSPLLNDPFYRVIGVGTRIFLGGGVGYVAWQGTQHNPSVERNERGVPKGGAGTLALIGDLKGMSAQWLWGVSVRGYGCSLAVGVGVPIPILDEETLYYCSVSDEEILAPVVDYSSAYPEGTGEVLGYVSYAQLRSGKIVIKGKEIPTFPLSSYQRAREIAQTLKRWIQEGNFELTRPVVNLPGVESGVRFKNLKERPVENYAGNLKG
ncbi:homocysteine biosynthesis protein [Thermatribacter velox]|uniref:Homocysteine biosynthesis protein n=1 Tax=Thermatribacter velox TaxID=3039681 RepID=A0ABZ2YGG6_9BACT